MYCGNCGKKLNDNEKFCLNCGYGKEPQQVGGYGMQPQQSTYSAPPVKKSGGGALAIIIIVVIVLFVLAVLGFIGFIFFIVFSAMSDAQTIEYVVMGDDEVPTIYTVFDNEYSMCGFNTSYYNEEAEIIYTYCDDSLGKEDFDRYLDYLVEEEKFEEIGTIGRRGVTKVSVDDGFIIEVAVDFYEGTITYEKIKGEVETDYIESV